MTTGTIKTQGTRLFFAHSESEILKVACPTGIQGLGGAGDQVDTTCLDSVEREYQRGLLNPAAISVPFNFIPHSAAHQALIDLRESGAVISWMIVFSDQAGSPNALDSDSRLVSPGATTGEFLGYVADVSFDASVNEIVRGTLTIQRSGAVNWTFPTADLP